MCRFRTVISHSSIALAVILSSLVGCTADTEASARPAGKKDASMRPAANKDENSEVGSRVLPAGKGIEASVTTKHGHQWYTEKLPNGEVRFFLDLAEGYSTPPRRCTYDLEIELVWRKELKKIWTLYKMCDEYKVSKEQLGHTSYISNAVWKSMNELKKAVGVANAEILQAVESVKKRGEEHFNYHWRHVKDNRWELLAGKCEESDVVSEKIKRQVNQWISYVARRSDQVTRAVKENNRRLEEGNRRTQESNRRMRESLRQLKEDYGGRY